jgi:hypothetical protein
MQTQRRPRPGAHTGKLIAGALAALLVILVVFWWTSAQELPTVSIPNPVLPIPNAFITFDTAGTQLQDNSKIGYAVSARHSGIKDDRDYTWVEKEKLVSENAATLVLLRQGLNEVYVNPPARSINAVFPYFARFRGMARLLALEAAVKAHKGDCDGAARASTDAMEMGAEIPHGSPMIGGLVGIACQAIGRRPLWQYVDHLNAKQARAAVLRMERIRRKQVPFSGTMQEEKWSMQATLLEIMRKPNSMGAMAQAMGNPAPPFTGSVPLSQLAYLVYSKRRIMNDYTAYMDSEIARAKLPYGTKNPTPVPNDPIVQIIAPVFEQAGLKFTDVEAKNGLIEVAFALRAYKLEHGSYPDSLATLVPGDLPQLPADPFGKGATFGYRRADSTYVLYSIGPDGKDDGGKPIDTGASRASNPNERYFVKSDSAGDIVAGKNIW